MQNATVRSLHSARVNPKFCEMQPGSAPLSPGLDSDPARGEMAPAASGENAGLRQSALAIVCIDSQAVGPGRYFSARSIVRTETSSGHVAPPAVAAKASTEA